MLLFLTVFFTVKLFLLWSELPSGDSHVTFGMAARYWTTWTLQVREYGCPVIAKVEGVNWTFGRGSAAEKINAGNVSHF